MPDLTPDHPAVEAVAREIYVHDAPSNDPQTWPPTPTALADDYRGAALAALSAALPHLTADDLRATDAAEEIRTEGWMQGWAAGRDLDGDEDATPYLRNTPAGRKLMAEGKSAGWDDAIKELRKGQGVHRAFAGTLATRKPNYEEGDA